MNDTTQTSPNPSKWRFVAAAVMSAALLPACADSDDADDVEVVDVGAVEQSLAAAAPATRTRTIALPADLEAIPGSTKFSYPGWTSPSFTQPAPLIVPREDSIRDPNTGMCLASPAFSRRMGRSTLEHLPQAFFDYLEYGMVNPPPGALMLPVTDDRMKVREFLDLMGPETAYGVRYYHVQPYDPVTNTFGAVGPLESCVETYRSTSENPAVLRPLFHIAIKDNRKQLGGYLNPASENWATLLADPGWFATYSSPPYSLTRIGSLEVGTTTGCFVSGPYDFHGGPADTSCVETHEEMAFEFDPLGTCPNCYTGPILSVLDKLGLYFVPEGWEPAFVYDAGNPRDSKVELRPGSFAWDESTGWSFTLGPMKRLSAFTSLTRDEQKELAETEHAWRDDTGRSSVGKK